MDTTTPSYTLLTVPQAAQRLTVSAAGVYRLIAEGKLRLVKPTPGTSRVRSDEVEAYLDSVTEDAPRRVRVTPRRAS